MHVSLCRLSLSLDLWLVPHMCYSGGPWCLGPEPRSSSPCGMPWVWVLRSPVMALPSPKSPQEGTVQKTACQCSGHRRMVTAGPSFLPEPRALASRAAPTVSWTPGWPQGKCCPAQLGASLTHSWAGGRKSWWPAWQPQAGEPGLAAAEPCRSTHMPNMLLPGEAVITLLGPGGAVGTSALSARSHSPLLTLPLTTSL